MPLLMYLPVAPWAELIVWQRMFGMDGFTQVGCRQWAATSFGGEIFRGFQVGVNIEQSAQHLGDFKIKVVEKVVFSFKKRVDVIGIIVEKRGFSVGSP